MSMANKNKGDVMGALGMSKEDVLKYLKRKPRFISGVMRNGHFEPVAMLSKRDNIERRVRLGAAMAKINDVKTKALRRLIKG